MAGNKRDRATGLPTGNPVTPPTSVCFRIMVPNSIEHRSAFKGALSELGKAYNWHQEIGVVSDDANEAAELWRGRISEAVYSEGCDDVLDCEDVANCIATSETTQGAIVDLVNENEALQSALANQISINVDLQQAVGQQARYGAPMAAGQSAQSLTVGADCDLNKLFGSITAIVDQLHTNNLDFLEQVEIESNTIERSRDIIRAIPFFETLPVDDVVAFADQLIETFKENYEAIWTTALRDEYRCDLFCAAGDRTDCVVSFDILISYFEDRLGETLDPNAFFLSTVEFFVTGSWTGTQIVDALMLAQLGIWRGVSEFLGLSIRTLATVAAIGANDDDADWEILCEDCPPIANFYPAGTLTNGTFNGLPYTFISNNPDGGSTWDITLQSGSGIFAAAIHFTNGVTTTHQCVILESATNVTSYNHNRCVGGVTSGSGSGASPTVPYVGFGFYGASAATVRVEIKPS